MSSQDRFNFKRKVSKKTSLSGYAAKKSTGSNSKVTRPNVLLKKRKESPVSHYPEMVAPDLNQEEPKRPITPIVEELTRIKERVTEALMKYETPNPKHGHYEILLGDRDFHERELSKLMIDVDQYSEDRDEVLCELIESFSEQLATLDDLKLAQLIEDINNRPAKAASSVGGSSTLLTSSVPSVVDSEDIIDGSGAVDKVIVDHHSIRTAKNLARVFSLEDKLQQHLSFSQDELSMKIPQLLMEDESLLEEVMTEQVLRAVKALKLYIVIEKCLDKLRRYCEAIPSEAKEVQNLMSLSGERLRNMYLGYFCEVVDKLKDKATNLRKNMAKLCIILDNFDPQRNTQIQKEDEYPVLINLMFHCSLLMEKELCNFFEGNSNIQTWIVEGAKELREILQDKAQEAQVLASRTRMLSIRPTKEIKELQDEMEILGLVVRQFSHSLAQGEDGHEVLSALKELSQSVDTLVTTGKIGFTVQVSDMLQRNVVTALGKLGIRVPSQTVCQELLKMGVDSTIELDDVIDKMPKSRQSVCAGTGTKTKKYSKHKGPKMTGGGKRPSTSVSLKRTSVSSQSAQLAQKHLLSRERAKISVKDRDKNLEAKVSDPRPVTSKHGKSSRVLSHQKSFVETKWQTSTQLSRDTDYQDTENDSDLEDNGDEMNKSIRYSRRMPLFPPVSSSHAQAQSEVIKHYRIRSSQSKESSVIRTSVVGPHSAVERKSVTHPLNVSVVSLKLPSIA